MSGIALLCFFSIGLMIVGYAQIEKMSELIAALKDEEWIVRSSAENALVEIGQPAVDPLIAALKDKEWIVRSSAADALRRIADSRAIDPLIAALKDKQWAVRSSAADALGKIADPRANQVLLTKLEGLDFDVICGAYSFYIGLGLPESKDALIQALNDSGSLDMATDFLNCGDAELESAAKQWAKKNDLMVVRFPEARNKWGGRR